MFKHVFIVAGHGGVNEKDVGTTYDNFLTPEDGDIVTERMITKSVGAMVASALGEYAIPIGIDESLTVPQKISKVNAICKRKGLDHTNSLLVSLHVDWYKAPSGFGAYYYDGSEESKRFANHLCGALSTATKRSHLWTRPDTSSRFGRIGIVRDTKPLATLVELGDMQEDLATLIGEAGRDEAETLVSAIKSFAGWSNEVVPPPVQSIDTEAVIQRCKTVWAKADAMKKELTEVQAEVSAIADVMRDVL